MMTKANIEVILRRKIYDAKLKFPGGEGILAQDGDKTATIA